MMPSLFLAHGSPMIALEDTAYTRYLEQLGAGLKPKAIVIFTAHWESPVLTVSSMDSVYETIYDFGGFPPELYAVKYEARGSVVLASQVKKRFEQKGIEVRTDTSRGLDHGSWTLLRRLFPKADIPVVQISVHPFLPPSEQYRIGEALQGIGEEDVLVIGSGVTVHNLRALRWDRPRDSNPEAWAVEFDDWIIRHVEERRLEELYRWEELAPHARLAVPREEHFVPLFIALGSGDPSRKPKVLHRSYDFGTLSYLCFEF
ncbi:class III extradiol ring-cleavage dioxygenase [Paenibacillus sp. GD4]|uniref:dioxygenase family protein n=1 Tax=Paenibacillus sp. GD4 TaxID=3068890 RepID=UPI0027964BA8|nr:class III extradiol ring-cleavage dioxygenase [Paenibacillus sp. GD4]MDQ1911786.1 class III extradiol ring-cleavage dioxygenase [Paenibacillus sp. GD4]